MPEEKPRRRERSEIEAEIAVLRELLPRLQQFNFFNEDTHEEHEAQVDVMEFNLTEDQIYWRYQDTASLLTALDTLEWMEGRAKSRRPSERWNGLLIPVGIKARESENDHE